MHIDVNCYQLMLGYTYEILHINGATSPLTFDWMIAMLTIRLGCAATGLLQTHNSLRRCCHCTKCRYHGSVDLDNSIFSLFLACEQSLRDFIKCPINRRK